LTPLWPIGYNRSMNTTEHKRRAAELGLEWSAVLDVYREIRGLEIAELDRTTAARRDAFKAAAGDAHGGRFKGRHRAAFNGGDATYIPGLDVVAADRGLTADELFADLATAADGLRPADEVMAEALDRAAALAAPADESADMMPLVAAAAAADITEQWLRQLVKAGRIRGRKAGRNWLVSAADVAFFARHPTAGRPRREAAPF
jgi:hypothetical protein